MKKFNLNEERNRLFKEMINHTEHPENCRCYICHHSGEFKQVFKTLQLEIERQDKEFIRRLKELFHLIHNGRGHSLKNHILLKEIDKLAGDKLI